MRFYLLGEPLESISSGFIRILPDRPATIQTIFNYTRPAGCGGIQREFENARPTSVKGQPVSRVGNIPQVSESAYTRIWCIRAFA